MWRFLVFFSVVCYGSVWSQPTSWSARGVGGGGAVYSPAISIYDSNEVFISCDMTPVHHSLDFGLTWDLIPFQDLTGNRNSMMQFTNSPEKLFTLKRNGSVYQPVKSDDHGVTWGNVANPCVNSAFQLKANYFDSTQLVMSDQNQIYYTADEATGVYSTLLSYPLPYGTHLAGAFFKSKDTIFVCSHDSIIYTEDKGNSWNSIAAGTQGIPLDEHIVSFDGAFENGAFVLYAVTIQANAMNKIFQTYSDDFIHYAGVYKLSFNATQWESIGGNLPHSSDRPYLLALDHSDTSLVYLAGNSSSSGTSLGAVFVSMDAGNSFSNVFITPSMYTSNDNVTTGWMGKQVLNTSKFSWNGLGYICGISIDQNHSNRLLICDGMLVHTSTDYGVNWKQAYTDEEFEHLPGTLIQQDLNYQTTGLETTTSYWLTWFNDSTIFASYNDLLARRSEDGGKLWNFEIYGLDSSKINDVNMTLNDSTHHIVYAACGEVSGSNGDFTDARVSITKGRISYSLDEGIQWNTLTSFGKPVTSICFDPINQWGMYCTVMDALGGIGGVYYCSDVSLATPSWTKLNDPPRTEGRAMQIQALSNGDLIVVYYSRDISPNSNPIYVYSQSAGVFYSNDFGNSWSDNNPTSMQLSSSNVTIDPNDSTESTWWACVGNNGTPGGVFKTIDKGQNWIQVYDQASVSISFHPIQSNTLYLCTMRNGLLHATATDSTTWSLSSIDSYPFRNPQRVFFNPYQQNEVWVTSFGVGNKVGYESIIQQEPFITWIDPDSILYGNPLTSTQLNASANVSGTFVYSPPLGTILNQGTNTLYVTFYPDDSVNYTLGLDSVFITVYDFNALFQEKNNPILIYPNPSHDWVNIKLEKEFECTILTLNGEVLFKSKAQNQLSIDVSNYQKGIYLFQINQENRQSIGKIVIMD